MRYGVDRRAARRVVPGAPRGGARPARPERCREDQRRSRCSRGSACGLPGGSRCSASTPPWHRAVARRHRRRAAVVARSCQVAGARTPRLPGLPLRAAIRSVRCRARGTSTNSSPPSDWPTQAEQDGREALGGPATPARRRARSRRPPRAGVPRRADDGARPEGATRVPRPGAPDLARELGATILMTTHDLDEAETLADRIIILVDGRIIADGTSEQLARQIVGHDEVRWVQDGRAARSRGPRLHRVRARAVRARRARDQRARDPACLARGRRT